MTEQLDTLLQEAAPLSAVPGVRRRRPTRTEALYRKADRDREAFWAEQARALDWITPWTRVLDWKPPHAQWFVGGRLNVSANCLDRHSPGPAGTRRRSSGRASRATGGS